MRYRGKNRAFGVKQTWVCSPDLPLTSGLSLSFSFVKCEQHPHLPLKVVLRIQCSGDSHSHVLHVWASACGQQAPLPSLLGGLASFLGVAWGWPGGQEKDVCPGHSSGSSRQLSPKCWRTRPSSATWCCASQGSCTTTSTTTPTGISSFAGASASATSQASLTRDPTHPSSAW